MSSQCWQRRPKPTFPESDGSQIRHGEVEGPEDGGLLEVRAGRWLRVCHLNARPRDAEFRRQQETVAQYHGYGHPAVRRPQPDASPKHVSFVSSENVAQAVHIPHAVNTRRNLLGVKSNRVSPAPDDFNRRSPVVGAPDMVHVDDRGSSAASVAFSLQSRQSYAPSPAEGTEVPQNVMNKTRLGKNNTSQNKMVLFFIHGVGGSVDTWRAQLDHFGALGYEIVAPDLIGHGLSMAPDQRSAYHFEEIAKDVEAIFDKFCKRRNIIIGHSYGCSFGAILARKRSRWVTKLVLISGGGPTPLAPQPGVFSLPTSILACLRPCLNLSFTHSAYHRHSKVHVPRDRALDVPTYVLSHTMNGQLWAEGDELFHNWLNVAALLIYGKHDQLITLAEEQTMVEAIYGSRLEVVDGASHMVMIEQPEAVNSLILGFIQS